jgi:hypothetical protein
MNYESFICYIDLVRNLLVDIFYRKVYENWVYIYVHVQSTSTYKSRSNHLQPIKIQQKKIKKKDFLSRIK